MHTETICFKMIRTCERILFIHMLQLIYQYILILGR